MKAERQLESAERHALTEPEPSPPHTHGRWSRLARDPDGLYQNNPPRRKIGLAANVRKDETEPR